MPTYNPIGADANGNLPPLVKGVLDGNYAPASQAVPIGGSAGQVLAKTSDGVEWVAPPSGGSGVTFTENPPGSGLYEMSSGALTEDPPGSGLYAIPGA